MIIKNKVGFLSSSSSVRTIEWMHHNCAYKTHRENARWELHKDATRCYEQIQEVTSQKTAFHLTNCLSSQKTAIHLRKLPLISQTIQIRRTKRARHCWWSKDELKSDVLLGTPTYRYASVGQLGKTYISNEQTQDAV